ncbi:MAG TPA: SUMF1/EgtB/PvdO family nonheme iron enzyme, partial [Polyangiaceae bacterium]|nr:SUMF1/EgtB/PvdO family nonheme iron enzyme [Polyangiaceae bacterium]
MARVARRVLSWLALGLLVARSTTGCARWHSTRARADAMPAGSGQSLSAVPRAAHAPGDAGPQSELAASAESRQGARPTAPTGMLWVPGGTFVMGSDTGGQEDEHPAHPVTLRAFFLDRTEVTNQAYALCVSAGKCRAP